MTRRDEDTSSLETGMSQLTMSPRDAPELDIPKFFRALSVADAGKREEARKYFNAAFGKEKQPSPRARPYVESGEWEVRDVAVFKFDRVGLGKLCKSEIGGTKGGEEDKRRFCANTRFANDGSCAVSSHTATNRLVVDAPGYYISTGDRPYPTRGGVRMEPHCDLGPPFDDLVDFALLDVQACTIVSSDPDEES
jgi:hypothetical protein